MKILLSAIACNPVTGSDAYFGWSAARALAALGEVHVLTHGFSRAHISPEDESSLPGVKFHFLGHPIRRLSRNGLLARVQAWRGCRDWQARLVLPFARELHSRERFDLIHHVTISSWRLASPLWKLGIPLVWGPLGGGEEVPPAFRSLLSPGTRVFERFRAFTSLQAKRSHGLRECARGAAISLAANQETLEVFKQIGCSRVELLASAFFHRDRIERFRRLLASKVWHGPLRIFSGGNLEGRKGVSLSLRALAILKRDGTPFQYQMGGGGAEATFLKSLGRQLGLGPEDVVFGDVLSGSDYDKALSQSHVYLLPSLRENAGLTMMEAMLAGCVPVVMKLGGPGEIVTEYCGFPIKADQPSDAVKQIALTLQRLHEKREICKNLGEAASERICSHYSESAYLANIKRIYGAALNRASH